MLTVGLDRFHPSTFESGDGCRPGVADDLARDAPPQRGRRAPDRVALMPGRGAAQRTTPFGLVPKPASRSVPSSGDSVIGAPSMLWISSLSTRAAIAARG